jgi:transposase
MSAPVPSAYQLFVGVDIAKDSATVAWSAPTPTQFTIAQTPAGYQTLLRHLAATRVPAAATLVALEATSTYWLPLALALTEAGLAVSVINPSQAHHFAQALLRRAKTDQLDAQLLAAFAAQVQPPRWTPPPPIYYELQQRLAERAALRDQRQQVVNRLGALQASGRAVAAVVTRMQTHIAWLDGQIAEVTGELATSLTLDEHWAATAARLQTIPGIALITSVTLLVATLNFAHSPSAASLAAYAGLVPQVRQSGSSGRGRARLGHRGHVQLRTALYMAAVSAIRCNEPVRAYYHRLVAAGRAKKAALCAAARKLVHLAWAVATKQRRFAATWGERRAAAA